MRKTALILAGLLMFVASSAWATPLTLTIQYGGVTPIVVQDGSLYDLNNAPGFITYDGLVGNAWQVSVDGSISSALSGAGISRVLFHAENRYLGTGKKPLGDLILTLNGMTGPWAGNEAVFDVEGNSTLPFGSALFTTNLNGHRVSKIKFAGLNLDATGGFWFKPGVDNSLELIAAITHPYVGHSSFDYQVTAVPEGGTLMLLGIAFLGLAIYSKRRKNL